MSRPTLSSNAHSGDVVAPTKMIEEAGSVCESDSSESQEINDANHHSRAAAGALPKLGQALLSTPPPLLWGIANQLNSLISSCSGTVHSRESCAAAADAETTTAVAVTLRPPFTASLLQARRNSTGRTGLSPRDPHLPTPPLIHSAVQSATEVSPPLDGGAIDFTTLIDHLHMLSISSSLLCTSTAWRTPAAAVAIASRLLGDSSSLQQVDLRVNAHSGAAATGAATAAMPPAQASVVPLPLTPPLLSVLRTTNDCTGEGTTLHTAFAIGEVLSAVDSTEALAAVDDSVNSGAGALYTSYLPAHSPPTTVVALLLGPTVADDDRFFADPSAATAADLHSLLSSNIMTLSDTSRLTPAAQGTDEERCAQSRVSRHRTADNAPDFRPHPLNNVARGSLMSSLGSLSGSSLAAGATATPVASGTEPTHEAGAHSSKGGNMPSPLRCIVAILNATAVPLSAVVEDSLHESLPTLSATAAATTQQREERRGTTKRHAMHNSGPPRGDGTTAPLLMPLTTPGRYVRGAQCMSAGAPDACLLVAGTLEPAEYAQTLRVNPPCTAPDTDSKPPQPASESGACGFVSEMGTRNGASTLDDTSAVTQSDSQHRGDALDYRSTSVSDVQAHFPPMSLQAATCQEANLWCDQRASNANGSCCGDTTREPAEETAGVEMRGTSKENRPSTLHRGDCVGVQLSAEADGARMLYMVPESRGARAQDAGCVEQEGCGGSMSARSLSHHESRLSPTLYSPAGRSIAAVVVQLFNSIGEGSFIPSVATTAPLSPAVASPLLTAPQATSVPPSRDESLDIQRHCAALHAQINTTRTSRCVIPAGQRASTPRPSARTPASLSSIGSAQPISYLAAVTTGSTAAFSQVRMTAAGPPVQLAASSQVLTVNTSKGSVARSSAAARHIPSPMLTASSPKLPPAAGMAYDVPVEVATAGDFPGSGTPADCAVDHAYHSAAALSCLPAPGPPTLQGELVAPRALPMRYSTETAWVARRYPAMLLPHSAPRNAGVSRDGRAARGGPNPPPSPSALSVMSISARAISASPYNRAPMFTRLQALHTPRSASHRRSSSSSRSECRAAGDAVLATSVAPPHSFAHVTSGKPAQAELCRALMRAKSPPRPPSRCAAHTLPFPVRVVASPVTASSPASREATLLCRPLVVRDADTESEAPSIIPGTSGTVGSTITSPAVSELLGLLNDWTPTRLAMSTPQRTSQRAAAAEMAVVPGALAHKCSTATTPPVADIAVSEAQAQLLSRRTKLHTLMRPASGTGATPAAMGAGDARGGCAAAAAFPNDDWRGGRSALRLDSRASTAAAAKGFHVPLSTHVVPDADNFDHLVSAPKRRRTPPICSRTRAGEIPSAVGAIDVLPALASAAATPPARDAAATARHPLPRSLGPSWERMESLPVGLLAPATPTATPPTARTLPLHSVPLQMSGAPTTAPQRVSTPPALPFPLGQRRAPREEGLAGHGPATQQHSGASGLNCQPSPLTTPRLRGKGGRHGFASSAALAMPPAPPAPPQCTRGTAASASHHGEVMYEGFHDTHGSCCGWPISAPSCPSSVASSCLQRHRLQKGCRSGLPRSVHFPGLSLVTMPTPVLSQTPEATVRRTLSTEPGGHGGGQAGPGPQREPLAAHRKSPSHRLWWRGRCILTPGQKAPGRLQPQGQGARPADLVGLPPNPDMLDGTGEAAAPHRYPTFSSPATTAAATGEVGSVGDARGMATPAVPITATVPPLRLYTMHRAPISEYAGGRAGAEAAGGVTSGCATAGEPLYRVAAALPVTPPGAAVSTEAATAAKACAASVLEEATNCAAAYRPTRQPRSSKSGQLQPSPAFPPQSSVGSESQSPQHGRGGATGGAGNGSGSLPVGMPSSAFATAAGQSKPRLRYNQSGAPLQRCDERINAPLRDAGKGKGYDRQQRAPRLTRSMLDRLQRSYAATAAASTRPHCSPTRLPCKEALIADWRGAIDRCADGGSGADGLPATPRRRRLSASSRGECVEDHTAALPRSGWSVAHTYSATSSPLLHAVAGPASIHTRTESPLPARIHLAAAPQASLYREQCTSSSPDPVAPKPLMCENRVAVQQAPNLKALPLLPPAHQAHPRPLRRNLVEQPPRKPAARSRADVSNLAPVASPEMHWVPAKLVATPSPLQASLEHEQAPVLTAVINVPSAPRRVPWAPKGKCRGGNDAAQSAIEVCPQRGWSEQSISAFLRGLLKQRQQRRGGRMSLTH
ncbi:hypothetical protein CUR178_05702 [Leishmania enriettii]|uniref:Uncharacterized protein n=1 Tax=Leishmania enriettii TaxID=5663 RepID=A0A836HTC9_LEIEN|nr:hypothetical protein CUR178_05702 [Leishmania enriettii]